jgi:hypothetical protein
MGNLRDSFTDEEWELINHRENPSLDRELYMLLIGLNPHQREELREAIQAIVPPFYRLEGISPDPTPENRKIIIDRLIQKLCM